MSKDILHLQSRCAESYLSDIVACPVESTVGEATVGEAAGEERGRGDRADRAGPSVGLQAGQVMQFCFDNMSMGSDKKDMR